MGREDEPLQGKDRTTLVPVAVKGDLENLASLLNISVCKFECLAADKSTIYAHLGCEEKCVVN